MKKRVIAGIIFVVASILIIFLNSNFTGAVIGLKEISNSLHYPLYILSLISLSFGLALFLSLERSATDFEDPKTRDEILEMMVKHGYEIGKYIEPKMGGLYVLFKGGDGWFENYAKEHNMKEIKTLREHIKYSLEHMPKRGRYSRIGDELNERFKFPSEKELESNPDAAYCDFSGAGLNGYTAYIGFPVYESFYENDDINNLKRNPATAHTRGEDYVNPKKRDYTKKGKFRKG